MTAVSTETADTGEPDLADLADQLAQLSDADMLTVVNMAMAARQPKADEQTTGDDDQASYDDFYPTGSKR